MLLCGIINDLERDGHIVSYFFCQKTDPKISNATAVLRGLISMLIDRQPSLLPHLEEKVDHANKRLFENSNAWVAAKDIFKGILCDSDLRCTYLVVDALDECQTERRYLLDLIVSSSMGSRVKWIVSSRNLEDMEISLKRAIQKMSLHLELNAKSEFDPVFDPVQLYIQEKVRKLAEHQGYTPDTTARVTSYLSSNTGDSFHWVALVCQVLDESTRSKLSRFCIAFRPA